MAAVRRRSRLKPTNASWHRLALVAAGLLCIGGIAHAFPWSDDMRRSPAFKAQRKILYPPDSTVSRAGKPDMARGFSRETSDKIPNPTQRTPGGLVHGDTLFTRYCVPCHGASGEGNGLVAQKFPGVANLMLDVTKNRTDGYIYFYIRHGGILMPGYGYAIDAKSAWDVISYLRKLQGK